MTGKKSDEVLNVSEIRGNKQHTEVPLTRAGLRPCGRRF
jgi:hypothetical protein